MLGSVGNAVRARFPTTLASASTTGVAAALTLTLNSQSNIIAASSGSSSLFGLTSQHHAAFNPYGVRFASKAAGGSTKNTRDSAGRRLGWKVQHLQKVMSGTILRRQRGTEWHPGMNVTMAKDHTIHAGIDGQVQMLKVTDPYRHGKARRRGYVSVLPYGQRLPPKKLIQQAYLAERHLHVKQFRACRSRKVKKTKFMVPATKMAEYLIRQATITHLKLLDNHESQCARRDARVAAASTANAAATMATTEAATMPEHSATGY